MLLAHGTVVALVDGERLELYRNAGQEAEPRLERLPQPDLDEHNKGSGGRHYSSAGNPQPTLLDEDAHAAAVAEWLNHQAIGRKIERLVVIAPPRTLGELRKHYHKLTEQALVAELHKELLGQGEDAIVAALRSAS